MSFCVGVCADFLRFVPWIGLLVGAGILYLALKAVLDFLRARNAKE